MEFIGETNTGATFSECRRYRWSLWRRWVHGCPPSEMVSFIGLNPSTADEFYNDPTVARCIQFAKDWGFGGMVMLNIFGFRATDPLKMKEQLHPIGEFNDQAIHVVTAQTAQTICAWGVHGAYHDRGSQILLHVSWNHRKKTFHLGLTKAGHPKHPLYLRADTKRQEFTWAN